MSILQGQGYIPMTTFRGEGHSSAKVIAFYKSPCSLRVDSQLDRHTSSYMANETF